MTPAPPSRGHVCAGFVTYAPDAGFPQRLERVAAQVDRVVLVDNGSLPEATAPLRALARGGRVDVVLNRENLGLATALNQAARWARERGYPWLLTLDQDCVVADGLVAALGAIYESAAPRERIGLIGANFRDPNTGELGIQGPPADRGEFFEHPVAITSGSLMSLAAFEAVGPFRDDFFIDSVDHEYCLRLRAHDYAVLVSRAPLMAHPIGARRRHSLLWWAPICSHHGPLRRYYMARNRLVIALRYRRTDARWVLRNLAYTLKEALLVLLFEERAAAKTAAMLLGFWHALRGRMGRLDAPCLGG